MADKTVPERVTGWLTLLDLLGVKGALLSLATSFAIAAWSWAKGLPGPEIAVLALVAAAATLILAVPVERFRRSKANLAVGTPAGTSLLREVRGRTFRNETVRLDGCDYIDCDFHSCTLQYDGGPCRITASRIHGDRQFATTVPAVANAFGFCQALGILPNTKVVAILVPGPSQH